VTGYVPWPRTSPMLDAIGGVSHDPDDPLRFGFRVEGAKLNNRGFLHAGVIATIGDVTLGHTLATRSDPPTPLVTVNLSCALLAPAAAGDWVDILLAPTRAGRRLAAATAHFSTTRPIATVTALFMPAAPPAG
jgi:acyl-coenzyme A thioesterase PaaI-like protein